MMTSHNKKLNMGKLVGMKKDNAISEIQKQVVMDVSILIGVL